MSIKPNRKRIKSDLLSTWRSLDDTGKEKYLAIIKEIVGPSDELEQLQKTLGNSHK